MNELDLYDYTPPIVRKRLIYFFFTSLILESDKNASEKLKANKFSFLYIKIDVAILITKQKSDVNNKQKTIHQCKIIAVGAGWGVMLIF